jgi:uncharacterized protein (TIGR03000 family)
MFRHRFAVPAGTALALSGFLLMAGPAAAIPVVPNPSDAGVRIEVRVPAAAEIWFDGEKTSQTGAVRHYQSPALRPGPGYVYTLRARWQEGNGTVERTEQLRFRAGDRLVVDWSRPRGTETQAFYYGPDSTPAGPGGAPASRQASPVPAVTSWYYTPPQGSGLSSIHNATWGLDPSDPFYGRGVDR